MVSPGCLPFICSCVGVVKRCTFFIQFRSYVWRKTWKRIPEPSPSLRFLLKFVWYRPGLLNGPPQSSAASCVVRSKITAVATGISGGARKVRKVGPESTAPAGARTIAIPQRLQRCRREPRGEGSLISRKSTGAQNSDRRIWMHVAARRIPRTRQRCMLHLIYGLNIMAVKQVSAVKIQGSTLHFINLGWFRPCLSQTPLKDRTKVV